MLYLPRLKLFYPEIVVKCELRMKTTVQAKGFKQTRFNIEALKRTRLESVNIACIALDFKVTVESECTSFVISYKSQNVSDSLKLFGDVTVYNGVTVY